MSVDRTYADIAADIFRFIDEVHIACRLHSADGYASPNTFADKRARPRVKAVA